jgi:hypothetical protein
MNYSIKPSRITSDFLPGDSHSHSDICNVEEALVNQNIKAMLPLLARPHNVLSYLRSMVNVNRTYSDRYHILGSNQNTLTPVLPLIAQSG